MAEVTRVEVIGDLRMRLTLEDGVVGAITFDERVRRGVVEPLVNPDVFARVGFETHTDKPVDRLKLFKSTRAARRACMRPSG